MTPYYPRAKPGAGTGGGSGPPGRGGNDQPVAGPPRQGRRVGITGGGGAVAGRNYPGVEAQWLGQRVVGPRRGPGGLPEASGEELFRTGVAILRYRAIVEADICSAAISPCLPTRISRDSGSAQGCIAAG